ncbi:urease accessory protein [Azomonas agilis]|uniref:Urease accessory protein n=1 Tax=Azomonas agilis TaxID=116849 RepID=A0A562J159_9GAMM|nr:HupE/UreJ family protein [Azomonas agilis]TWH76535.1 urease accessory protein [Azomonas agilis]
MNLSRYVPLGVLACFPAVAFAHPGHMEQGFMAGLLHPLTGMDHLLAMLALGIWAALQKGSLRWALPLTFLGALSLGFVMGHSGWTLPQVETGISLSVLLLGLLVAATVRLPAFIALALAAVFALFHGYAHGLEAIGSVQSFAAGFLLASLGLHLIGVLLTLGLQKHQPVVTRILGALVAASGALMVVAA